MILLILSTILFSASSSTFFQGNNPSSLQPIESFFDGFYQTFPVEQRDFLHVPTNECVNLGRSVAEHILQLQSDSSHQEEEEVELNSASSTHLPLLEGNNSTAAATTSPPPLALGDSFGTSVIERIGKVRDTYQAAPFRYLEDDVVKTTIVGDIRSTSEIWVGNGGTKSDKPKVVENEALDYWGFLGDWMVYRRLNNKGNTDFIIRDGPDGRRLYTKYHKVFYSSVFPFSMTNFSTVSGSRGQESLLEFVLAEGFWSHNPFDVVPSIIYRLDRSTYSIGDEISLLNIHTAKIGDIVPFTVSQNCSIPNTNPIQFRIQSFMFLFIYFQDGRVQYLNMTRLGEKGQPTSSLPAIELRSWGSYGELFISRTVQEEILYLVTSYGVEMFNVTNGTDFSPRGFEKVYSVPGVKKITRFTKGVERDGNLTLYLLITSQNHAEVVSFDLITRRERKSMLVSGSIDKECVFNNGGGLTHMQEDVLFSRYQPMYGKDSRVLTGFGPSFYLICSDDGGSSKKQQSKFYQATWNPLSSEYEWESKPSQTWKRGFKYLTGEFLYPFTKKKEFKNPNDQKETLHVGFSSDEDYVARVQDADENWMVSSTPYFGNTSFTKVIVNRADFDWNFHGRMQYESWCYLSVAAGILDYYSFNKLNPLSQCDVYNEYYNATDGCEFPRNTKQLHTAGSASNVLEHFGFKTQHVRNATFALIKQEIDNNRPMILGTSKHVVTIIGYAHDPYPNRHGSDYVIVWQTSALKKHHGIQWREFSMIRDRVTIIRPPSSYYSSSSS